MELPPIAPLTALPSHFLASLRARLVDADYDHAIVHEAEAASRGATRFERYPLIRWWLARRHEPRADLARLLAFEDELEADTAAALLGRDAFEALVTAGALSSTASGGTVRAAFVLYPMPDGPYVLSDHLWAGGAAVMGPSAGTSFVARMIPRTVAGSLLDLGCGAGSLALGAAMRGARRVVGVDINPRAVALARFNAALNDLRADFIEGDLAAPVAGERFDRVVAQPGFVARAAGAAEITFLHGGVTGDELAFRMLAAAPAVLAPGGRAMVLFQSPAPGSKPVAARIRSALGAAAGELDVLALTTEGASPTLQATVFASYEAERPDARYEAAVRRYLDHFAAIGTDAVEGVFAVVSRPGDERAHRRRYGVSLPLTDPAIGAAELDALLASLELSGAEDAELLGARLTIAEGMRLISEQAVVGRDTSARLRLEAPLRSTTVGGEITRDQVERLRAFEGGITVERALVAYARDRKRPPAALREEWVEFVRAALVRGRLIVG